MCFPVGFDKSFFTKKRGDTKWCLASTPLGGYVKIVDTREGNVAEADLPFVFDHQHPAERIAIIAAGPLTNLILVAVLYDLGFSFSITEIHPYVGTVGPASVAATTDFVLEDKILSANGRAIRDWNDIQVEILLEVEPRRVDMAVQTALGQQTVRVVDTAGTPETGKVVKNSGNTRLWPFKMTIRLGLVMKNGSMERTGLKAGDRLSTADGKPIEQWLDWVDLLRYNPNNRMTIGYERGDKVYEASIRLNARELPGGVLVGKVGATP